MKAMINLRMNVKSNKNDPKAIDPKFLINLGKLRRIGLSGRPSSKYHIETADDTIYFYAPDININILC